MPVQGQLGFKSESVWGTPVTVDDFHAGWLSQNPVRTQDPIISDGRRAGRRTPACASAGAKTVQGPFSLELHPEPFATLLTHMFGTVNTTGSGPYAHTATPGAAEGSFTAQVGIYGSGGTVHPFTYEGCKLTGWTIAGTAGETAKLDLDVIAQDYVTDTGLASASYAGSNCPFTFVHGSVSVAGSALAEVTSFNLEATIPRRIKHGIGSSLIMDPKENGRREHVITVETDFKDLTLHNLANTQVAVVLAFDNGDEDLTITTNALVVPSTPSDPGSEGEVTETFTAICMGTTDAAAVTAVLNNDEASAA